MPGGMIGNPSFYVDGDAWTCPNCGHTRRFRNPSPAIRSICRQTYRNDHKCPQVKMK